MKKLPPPVCGSLLPGSAITSNRTDKSLLMSKKNTHFDPDPDVIRSAWLMIRNHGERAMREATRQQQAMIKRGDTRGISLWWSIGQAIQELRRTKRAPHEPLN